MEQEWFAYLTNPLLVSTMKEPLSFGGERRAGAENGDTSMAVMCERLAQLKNERPQLVYKPFRYAALFVYKHAALF